MSRFLMALWVGAVVVAVAAPDPVVAKVVKVVVVGLAVWVVGLGAPLGRMKYMDWGVGSA